MSDAMLHGVLNMPLPDDPAECDIVTWVQFKQRAREAADRIKELELAVRYEADLAQQALDAREELEAKLAKAMEVVEMIASADVDAVLGQAVDLSCEIIGELMEDEDDE